jgi:hypothetical protein
MAKIQLGLKGHVIVNRIELIMNVRINKGKGRGTKGNR